MGIATSAPVENLNLILGVLPIRSQMESLLSEAYVAIGYDFVQQILAN